MKRSNESSNLMPCEGWMVLTRTLGPGRTQGWEKKKKKKNPGVGVCFLGSEVQDSRTESGDLS